MIDARIDKALARLVSLQEYERVRATYKSAPHSCVTYGPYVTQNRKEGTRGRDIGSGPYDVRCLGRHRVRYPRRHRQGGCGTVQGTGHVNRGWMGVQI